MDQYTRLHWTVVGGGLILVLVNGIVGYITGFDLHEVMFVALGIVLILFREDLAGAPR